MTNQKQFGVWMDSHNATIIEKKMQKGANL